MARRFGGSAVVVVAVVAFLLTLGLPWVGAPGGASKVTPGTALGPTPATLSRPLAGPLSAPQISCLAVPRSVPCAAGPDRPVVDLISNSSDSGARFQVGVTLPPASADSASVQSSFWVGLWVSGAPCSIDGASYLSITLYPPFSPAVSPASPDWVAQVPVVDLVPSGSCDPLCQNASAQTGIGGVPSCEDNIVVGGGWPSSPNVGHFAPGDRLSLSAWGDTNGTGPLGVWANDSSAPAESAQWSYGAGATVTGQPVGPRFAVSNASDGGWATPYDVAFGMTACPASNGLASCNTYDGLVLNATAMPLVTSASYWNATTSAWESYPWIATASSSGRCAGAPPLAACPDFSSYGGTGVYPTLAAVPDGAGAAWRIGGTAASLNDYGGNALEFPTDGRARWTEPAAVTVGPSTGSAGVASVNVTVLDPRGAAEVRVGALWCATGGPKFSEVQVPASGTLTNLTVTLSVSATNGSMTVWVSERSVGGVWSPPARGNVAMTGGTASCGLPNAAAPWFGAGNVTSVAGGFQLAWQENTSTVQGFRVDTHDTTTGANRSFGVGNRTSATILGLNSADPYTMSVVALSLSGTSTPSGSVSAGPPLPPLAVTDSASAGILWHGGVPTAVSVTISGGGAPFALLASLGNGSATTLSSPTNATNVTISLAGGVGFVDLRLTITDANGVGAAAVPLLWDVWAGPLAPVATASAGTATVGVGWSPSSSPAGPVTRYVVYLSANASLARTAYLAGVDNTTVAGPLGGVEVWNTTNDSVGIPWVDNVTASVLVVPYDTFGPGFAMTAPLTATPAPLAPGLISGGPGGPAPYTATFTTIVRTGTNDSISQAVYSFPGFTFVNANITRTDPSTVFLNASARIDSLGLVLVLLHVSDGFGGTAIVASDVWVSSGAPPAVTAVANPSRAYVGVSVNFTASATGTGPFSYQWSFGDGGNGSGASARHAYDSAGTFTAAVTGTDTGTGSSATTDVVVRVYAVPGVSIVTSPGPNGTGSYLFRAVLSGGSGFASFAWAFGDGSVARGQNVSHDFRSNGVFTVNVTATDGSLRSASSSVTVDVALPTGASPGGSGLGPFSPLSLGLLVAAIVGWLIAVVAILRLRIPAEPEEAEVRTNWD